MASDNVYEFTNDNFESDVLQADEPVLVDFWAPWCAPCRRLTPMIEELAGEYAGTARIGKLNIDDARETAEKYDVMAIPTLLLFQGGEVKERFTGGTIGKARLQESLDAAKA